MNFHIFFMYKYFNKKLRESELNNLTINFLQLYYDTLYDNCIMIQLITVFTIQITSLILNQK